jgi:hypothetical protein
VKDRVATFTVEGLQELEAAASQAQTAGKLPDPTEPRQLAYEIHALLLMGHAAYTTLGDPAVLERSRRGLERLLGAAAGLSMPCR